MALGARLKEARRVRGMTQPELAQQSGVPQGTISKMERTDQESSSFTVQLATALNCNPIWLSNGDGDSWLHGVREQSASYMATYGQEVSDLLERMDPPTRRLWIRIGKTIIEEEKKANHVTKTKEKE